MNINPCNDLNILLDLHDTEGLEGPLFFGTGWSHFRVLGPELLEKIKGLAQSVAEREGCVLYDMEFTGGARGKQLVVYIEGQAEGVSVGQLENVNKGLSLLLDVEDPIAGRYDLVVSSPGLERVLREPWHFEKAVGKDVKIKLLETPGKKSTLSGRLLSCVDNKIELEVGKEKEFIEISQIKKANVVFTVMGKDKKR